MSKNEKKQTETQQDTEDKNLPNIFLPTGPAIKPKSSAPATVDPLRMYLQEINRFPTLTAEEEFDLARRYQDENDQEAALRIITSNLRLVVKIAMDFQRKWMKNLQDLIQEGNVGLMKALQKFDPDKEIKFSYYAAFWVKAYILKFIMDNWRLVKVGTTQGQRKLFFKLKKEKQKLIDQGFFPETKLLSERLGVSEQEIRDMGQRLDSWDLSLDEPMKDDSDTERGAFFSSEDESVESQIAKKELETLLRNKVEVFKKQLNERELDIFEKRIFTDTPETLQEIGDKYAISRERVRQLEKNIVKKMKSFLEKEIPDFDSYYFQPDEAED